MLFLRSGLPALLFALITWQVAAHGPMARADERLSDALVHPDRVWELAANLGSTTVAVPVLAVALIYVAWRAHRAGAPRWWLPPLAAALLMTAVPLLVVPLKELIDRSGPPINGSGTGFYPSGHTATALVAYGTATLLLLPWLHRTFARRIAVITCLALNLAVAVGLILRGYHWPLDVVASWCLFAILLQVMEMTVARYGRRPEEA